jgi:hypothetical protein
LIYFSTSPVSRFQARYTPVCDISLRAACRLLPAQPRGIDTKNFAKPIANGLQIKLKNEGSA